MPARPMQIQLAPTPPKADSPSSTGFPAPSHRPGSSGSALSAGRVARKVHPQAAAVYPAWCRRLAIWLRPPAEPLSFCAEAGVWLAGGAVFRVAMHRLLLSMPQLWIPVAIALLTPAIVATALSFRVPRLSLLLGYRLCLIAAGLFLIGFWL